jgi:hypothetical protein
MEITLEALQWDDNDIANWNSFLQTKTGKRLIPKIAEVIPELLGAGDVNAILIRSGEVRGFQEAIRQLLSLTHVVEKGAVVDSSNENYPNLLNDSAWEGPKLT